MRGEDIADIRAVEDVLKGRQDSNPDRWSVFARNESVERRSVHVVLQADRCRTADVADRGAALGV